jgi:formamidopyrimidine-DNA glycosylase
MLDTGKRRNHGDEMPELPEVETMVNGLRESLFGQRVQRLRVLCDRLMRETSASALQKVEGGKIVGLSRKGKFLLFHLSNGSLLVFHLRMTGRLVLVPSDRPLSGVDRARLDFSACDWALSFEDQRKFGSLSIVQDGEAGSSLLDELGPDALHVGLREFREILGGSARPVKALLLDQRVIAGLGNIYVDECLHRAGIHPQSAASEVPPDRVRRLHAAVRRVLRKAITCGGSSVSNYRDSRGRSGTFQLHHQVYKREGMECRHCNSTILYIKVASRGTRYCPSCQKETRIPRRRPA